MSGTRTCLAEHQQFLGEESSSPQDTSRSHLALVREKKDCPKGDVSYADIVESEVGGAPHGEVGGTLPLLCEPSGEDRMVTELLRSRVRPRLHTQTIQAWEGTVWKVHADSFTAVLTDLTDPNHPEENATFDVGQVSFDDLSLLEPGAVFYWHIGYRYDGGPRGTKETFAKIRFRRLPSWNEGDVERLRHKAKEFGPLFGSNAE